MSARFRLFAAVLVAATFAVPTAHAGFWGDATEKVSDAIGDIFRPSRQEIPYCQEGQECTLSGGANLVRQDVNLPSSETAAQFFQRVTANVVGVLGVVGVLFIIYAGFLVMTAAGDEEQSKKAKSIVKGVLLGFVLIFLAWPIVSFVINRILAPAA